MIKNSKEQILDTIIPYDNQLETENLINFMRMLNQHQKKDLSIFLEGAMFMKNLVSEAEGSNVKY